LRHSDGHIRAQADASECEQLGVVRGSGNALACDAVRQRNRQPVHSCVDTDRVVHTATLQSASNQLALQKRERESAKKCGRCECASASVEVRLAHNADRGDEKWRIRVGRTHSNAVPRVGMLCKGCGVEALLLRDYPPRRASPRGNDCNPPARQPWLALTSQTMLDLHRRLLHSSSPTSDHQ